MRMSPVAVTLTMPPPARGLDALVLQRLLRLLLGGHHLLGLLEHLLQVLRLGHQAGAPPGGSS